MVERYSPYSMSPTTFEPTKTGAWVRYSDHESELVTLRARVEKAEWERDDAIATTKLLQQQLKIQNDSFAARLSEATRLAVEALEPFANRTFQFDGLAGEYFCNPSVQVNDLRRARTALDRLNAMKGESDG